MTYVLPNIFSNVTKSNFIFYLDLVICCSVDVTAESDDDQTCQKKGVLLARTFVVLIARVLFES